MSQRYKHNNASVSGISCRFVWATRRRRPVLVGKIARRLSGLLHIKAKELNIEIISLEIRPDHVHLFAGVPSNYSPRQIMFRLKGFTARMLRKEFPELMKLPSMWTTAFFCSTARNVSGSAIKRYIEAQSKK